MSGESQSGEKKASKTTTPPIQDDREEDQVDGPYATLDGETTGTNNTDAVGAGEGESDFSEISMTAEVLSPSALP